MDWVSILSVLVKQAPYLLFCILGLSMVLFGSTGKFFGGEIDQRTQPLLKTVGWVIFWLFLFMGFIELVSSGSLKDFLSLLINALSSPAVDLGLVLAGLSIFGLYKGINYYKQIQIERGYKIRMTPVIKLREGKHGPRMANILVENIGKGRITCAARLVKVRAKFRVDEELEEIDVHELNPDGRFLKWENNSGRNYIDLYEGIPHTLELLISHRENYTYGYEMVFWFPYDTSPQPLPVGEYIITIDFLRYKDGRYVKLSTFEKTLLIGIGMMTWAN